jgi:CSLREA domain-containing protein
MIKKIPFLFELFLILLLVLGLVGTAVLIPVVHAGSMDVNTTDDENNSDGDCSLREAIIAANTDTAVDACTAGNGDDIITLPPGTYLLTLAGAGEDAAQTGDLDLTANVTMNGGGQSSTIIDGDGADRIFDVHGGVATISGVTLQNGSAPSGGGINVNSSLTLANSRITGNSAASVGGGIYAGGTVTVTNGRIDNNSAGSGGGGLFVSFQPVTVIRSEISGNSSGNNGGGIYSSGTLALVNSTLSGNSANRDGGGLFVVESPNTQLYNVTISANTADADGDNNGDGGGVRAFSSVSVANSLIGGNSGNLRPDCYGTLDSLGYNLVSNVTDCTLNGDLTGNIIGADPVLGPLQNNGGSTLTQALLDGSPALNAAHPGGCRDQNGSLLATDQRGFDRPANNSPLCDIGAYEAGLAVPPPTDTPTPVVTPTATPELEYDNYLPAVLKQLS